MSSGLLTDVYSLERAGKSIVACFKPCYMLETPKALYTSAPYGKMERSENYKDRTMGNQQERLKAKLGWLAAIIEGEGWVSLCRVMVQQKNKKRTRSYTPNVGVCNSDKLIIDEVIRILNDLSIDYRQSLRNRNKNKDCVGYIVRKPIFEISVATHRNVRKLINLLLPYMIGKKKQRMSHLLTYLDIRASKPKSGPNSAHGEQEKALYELMYRYRGRNRFSESSTTIRKEPTEVG